MASQYTMIHVIDNLNAPTAWVRIPALIQNKVSVIIYEVKCLKYTIL